MIRLSVSTPALICRIPHGSRDVGIDFNSSLEKFVPVRALRISSSGTSPLTVTVAATLEIVIGMVISVFDPVFTITFVRWTEANPAMSALIV